MPLVSHSTWCSPTSRRCRTWPLWSRQPVTFGAEVVLADIRSESGLARHDPDALAEALQAIVSAPQPPPQRTE